jgi:serine/threonine protein kinase/WD40 repeat protein
MPLAPGTRLGPYEILASIGAGGMGEVYRARDTTLERDVAVKVLPAALAQDPERLARFKREAKVLASLNHPNIAQIYAVENRALIMELVGGQSPKGPLPLETALNFARQIALALEAAHEKGMVHRDLKPANVMITPDGVVKVLDFGLAAVAPASAGDSDPAASPTLTMPTQAGVILGTAAYMSPEQAAGKPVDKRADVWSFGVVFWEFLTGRRLFDGETISHTLADVLRGPIDFDKLPRETPPVIRALLRRCLDRNVKNRLRDIGEARIAIDAVLSSETSEALQPLPARRSFLPWAIAGVSILALAAVGWGWWRASQPVQQSPVRLDVDLGREISLRPLVEGFNAASVVISPDGTRLAYVASVSAGPLKLFTRRLDQPSAIELAGTDGAVFPFFSPDGQSVGFGTVNMLNKISVEGGPVVPLADMRSFSACWGEDGNIIFSAVAPSGLMLIPSSGGAVTPATQLASEESLHRDPQILPGGKALLFSAYHRSDSHGADFNKPSVEVLSLVDHQRKTLVPGGTSAHYVATSDRAGELVYSIKGALFAIPFDLSRLEIRGTAVPVLEGVAYETIGLAAHFDVSRAGTLVYRKASGGAADRLTTVQWLDTAGMKEPLLAKPSVYGHPSLSPDSKRLALEVRDGASQDIWVYDLLRDVMTRLTFGGAFYSPAWSPDGRYLVFSSRIGMFWSHADGAGQPQPFTQYKNMQLPSSFSPDGKRLAYTEQNSASGVVQLRAWTVPLEDSGGQLRAGKAEQFLKTPFNDCCAVFSPDGQWVAYDSNESGRYEVYVRAFPPPASAPGNQWQISNSGGESPMWSSKGHELLYQCGDQIMAVKYKVKNGSFVPEKPRVWLSKLGGATDFDLSPDGKRLAVVVPVGTTEATKPDHEVTFVFNFLDELRRRVPTGK